jgi:hypothetical protein
MRLASSCGIQHQGRTTNDPLTERVGPMRACSFSKYANSQGAKREERGFCHLWHLIILGFSRDTDTRPPLVGKE